MEGCRGAIVEANPGSRSGTPVTTIAESTGEDAEPHPEPERLRGAKEQLEARMHDGMSYLERIDQPALSELFSLSDAYRRSRSFRKLASSFGVLVRSMEQDMDVWPPAAWTEGGL